MSFFQRHWDHKREIARQAIESGRVIITEKGRRLTVICPDSDKFTAGAKELGGTWRYKTGIWTFRLASKRLVVELLNKCFPERNQK